MGSLSIQKGKRAERDVASRLNPILLRICEDMGCDVQKLQRNLKQTQQGGYDLDGLDWLAIEIKHHKAVALPSWWRQTCGQAGCDDLGTPIPNRVFREPVLIWKQHGGKWNVRMIGRLEIEPGRRLRAVVDISWDAFLIWFEKRVEVEIRRTMSVLEEPGLFE